MTGDSMTRADNSIRICSKLILGGSGRMKGASLWLSPGVLWVTLKYPWPQKLQERCFSTCFASFVLLQARLCCFCSLHTFQVIPSEACAHSSHAKLCAEHSLYHLCIWTTTLEVGSMLIQREEDEGLKSVNPGRTSLVAQLIGVCLPA